MNKKKKVDGELSRRLQLVRTTIRPLRPEQLEHAVGGLSQCSYSWWTIEADE